jgi:uncharacterized protein YbjQ (UPF0145 family)
MNCIKCGNKMAITELNADDPESANILCSTCASPKKELPAFLQVKHGEEGPVHRKQLKEQEEIEKRMLERCRLVIVSTTPSLEGWAVQKYLGIESVEFVIGTGPISELVSGVQDFFGARSSPFEEKLRAAKETAFETLKIRAALKGGNAVVGVDLDYIDFSGNRIGLIVNGTVVWKRRKAIYWEMLHLGNLD